MREAEKYMAEGFAAEYERDWPTAAAAFSNAVPSLGGFGGEVPAFRVAPFHH